MNKNRTSLSTRRALISAVGLFSVVSLLPLCSLAATRVVVWGCTNNCTGFTDITHVPASATNLVAVTVGVAHALGLRSNGTVVAWGDNSNGATTVPSGATNVVGIAAGSGVSFAVKPDGLVVPWGGNTSLTNVPARATNLVAIDALFYGLGLRVDGTAVSWGDFFYSEPVPFVDDIVAVAQGGSHSLALKGDGTVIGWVNNFNSSGPATPPPGLTNVVAIAASYHSLALKADGHVVAWGSSGSAETTVPAAATNIVAIAASQGLSLALRADGTVMAWGDGIGGSATLPPSLTNVVAISSKLGYSVALVGDGSLRFSHLHVPDRIAFAGRDTRFIVTAFGAGPLSYQWRHNGVDITGATNALLSLSQLQTTDAGTYSVLVSDGLASASTNVANLFVRTDVVVVTQPESWALPEGFPATFRVTTGGAGPFRYQWRHGGSDIANATNATLFLAHIGISDAGNYDVVVSNPYTNATSQPATLTVLPAGPTSVGQFSSDFESGLPLGTSLFGSASVAAGSGADGNRVLKLMASGQGSFGDLVIDEFSGGAPVTAFFASFDLLLGGGADRPADGFSFNFTTNFPAPPAYGNPSEEGLTNGLSLCFDTFDNFLVDHGPVTGTDDTAPAIDVKVNGRPLAFQSMAGLRVERTPGGSAPAGPLLIDPQTGQPLALETEPPAADGPTMTHFAPVTIELKVDGTLWVT
ncbi:MAG TPA: hypothetical protein VNU68_02630, partial [Verrucomicrobiae bacterium]|nr:hypothetical protein [Verrucomicrobiae bacterium]